MRMIVLALGCVWFAACSEAAPGGDDTSSPDAAVNGPVCGDSVCAASEVGSCNADCGGVTNMCGDGACSAGETSQTCPADCMGGAVCGDGTCDMAGGETSANCAGDCPPSGTCPADPTLCLTCVLVGLNCPPGHDPNTCTQCILNGGGGGCVGGLPNGVCDPGEDANICPFDCP